MTNSVKYRECNYDLMREVELGFRPVPEKTIVMSSWSTISAVWGTRVPEWFDGWDLEWWNEEMVPEFDCDHNFDFFNGRCDRCGLAPSQFS